MPVLPGFARSEESAAFFASIGLGRLQALPGTDCVVDDVLEITGADVGALILFDGDSEFVAVSAGLVVNPDFGSSGLFAYARSNPRRILLIEDLRYDPRGADSPLVLGPPHLRGFAAAPITVKVNLVIGAFVLGWSRPHALPQELKPFVRSAATLAAVLLKSLCPTHEDEAIHHSW